MKSARNLLSLISGGLVATTLLGCDAEKAPPDSSLPPVSTPTTPTDNKTESVVPATSTTPAASTPTPAVVDQPAAPTETSADAQKDKDKADAGEVKPETPPKKL